MMGGVAHRIAGCAGAVLLLAGLVFGAGMALGQDKAAEKPVEKGVKPLDENNPYKMLLSGKTLLPPELLALQDDDFANPGILAVKRGEALWNKVDGTSEKSCAFCHNKARNAMAGVGARYPAYSKEKKKPINLEQRINLCREKHMKARVLGYESDALLAITAYVKSFSRGRPVNVKIDGNMASFFEKGRKAYYTRRGQLNMSCAQCHEHNAGKKFRAQTLSQGHSNGFPAYRLSWENVGSLHRRFQNCNRLVRSQPFGLGSDAYVNLELYLAWRGRGLEVETPAVRN